MQRSKIAASLKSLLGFGKAGERKEEKKNTPGKKPLYLYRPMETAFSYRIEFREGKGYVYRGWSSGLVYIMEGEQLFRAGEDEPAFAIVNGRICSAADRNIVLAKIENGNIWTVSSGREPAYHIRDSITVQGTL